MRVAAALAFLAAALAGCGTESGPRIAVYTSTTGDAFRHTAAIEAGAEHLTDRYEGATVTRDPEAFARDLQDADVAVLLQINGNDVLPRQAFEAYVREGGGVVAIHAAANADRDWPFYVRVLGGARFRNHPPGELQLQRATVHARDPDHPAMAPVPPRWTRTDEWYNFAPEPGPAAQVLATLDERGYEEADGTPADPHPIVWTSGRALYTALGHGAEAWAEPAYRAHVEGAIAWAADSRGSALAR